jgi:hypothetical protein
MRSGMEVEHEMSYVSHIVSRIVLQIWRRCVSAGLYPTNFTYAESILLHIMSSERDKINSNYSNRSAES